MIDYSSIQIFSESELERIEGKGDPFLCHGLTGAALFCFMYSDIKRDGNALEEGRRLMDTLCSKIPAKPKLEIYNGICGIGISVELMASKGWIEEEPDDILESIDDYVYSAAYDILNSYNPRYEHTYLDILLYLGVRVLRTKNAMSHTVLKRMWFMLFNKLYFNLTTDFFIEPNPPELKYKFAQFLLVCSCGLQMGNLHSSQTVIRYIRPKD